MTSEVFRASVSGQLERARRSSADRLSSASCSSAKPAGVSNDQLRASVLGVGAADGETALFEVGDVAAEHGGADPEVHVEVPGPAFT